MRRIVIIAQGLSDGGSERVASTIANYYYSAGHKVLYLATYNSEREYPLDEGVEYRFIGNNEKGMLKALIHRGFQIKKIAKAFKADVAVSFVDLELLPLLTSGIPVIPSLRNDPKSTERGFVRKLIREITYSFSKQVVFQTEGARNYFNKHIQNRGIIIRNPLKEGLPYWKENGHEKKFITACRINKQKNIPMLIRAFAEFSKNHPEHVLEIYGDGAKEYREELEILVEELSVTERISFKGHTSQIHKIMCFAEAFFLTSDYEGLSNSMLEAMAVGIPCVCTDCPPGGAREMMGEREAGVLIPVGDVEALVVAMNKVADDVEFRKKLSEKEKYIREELDRDKIFSQWGEIVL